MDNLQINADRFMGFADVYDNARPKPPKIVKDIILKYLGRKNPELVVDLGCGTGLSTFIWGHTSKQVIGIEPSTDMLKLAEDKNSNQSNIKFISAFSDDTGLDDNCADIITCSQSFHWMNPDTTIKEISRLLKDGGIFAVYDCDWPPVCDWQVEHNYNILFAKVKEFENLKPKLQNTFKSWSKNNHLINIKSSNQFRYVREVVFVSHEEGNAERIVAIALSQGGLQSILKAGIVEIEPYIATFKSRVFELLKDNHVEMSFCYRMIVCVK